MHDESLLSRLNELQASSTCLEPSTIEISNWLNQLSQFSDGFIEKLPTNSTIRQQNYTELKSIFSINEQSSFSDLLKIFNKYIVDNGIDTASGRYLGFIPGGGIPISATADFMAALTNCYAGNIITAEGAVEMERAMIRWMCNLVGFTENSSGNLSSGGSYASMIALVTAREAFHIKAKDVENSVIYLTELTHHSIIKCLRTIGMTESIIRYIPVDTQFRMISAELEEMIHLDLNNGLKPFLIVATAGTTDTGSIDPLNDISKIANKHQLWLHIDAAYGGFFLLTHEGKKQLAGISNADSITLDPHKGLFLPYGIGAVLIKDSKLQKQAFSSHANYMQDINTTADNWSPSDMSPELTKHFRALRMWLPLAHYGIEPFRAALEEKLLLTKYLWNELKAIEKIEIACEPELSIIAFRYLADSGNSDEINKQLLDTINSDKRIFLSSTRLKNRYFIRIACLSFRTHLSDIKLTIDIIKNSLMFLQVPV